MFNVETPNRLANPLPRPLGIQPPSSPAMPFPPRWDRRGLELLVRAN
jgi:hypothetical protein